MLSDKPLHASRYLNSLQIVWISVKDDQLRPLFETTLLTVCSLFEFIQIHLIWNLALLHVINQCLLSEPTDLPRHERENKYSLSFKLENISLPPADAEQFLNYLLFLQKWAVIKPAHFYLWFYICFPSRATCRTVTQGSFPVKLYTVPT